MYHQSEWRFCFSTEISAGETLQNNISENVRTKMWYNQSQATDLTVNDVHAQCHYFVMHCVVLIYAWFLFVEIHFF